MTEVLVDVDASVEVLRRGGHVRADGMLKYPDDLARFAHIIEATKPDVIVETGTRTGASARWFLNQPGVHEVITIDINAENATAINAPKGRITFLGRNSIDPKLIDALKNLVGDRRCMVTLDSDHSAPHVAREIELYGPLVSPGCYLVVEDTIFGYAPRDVVLHHLGNVDGTPLDAVATLEESSQWRRDVDVETMTPVTASPAGWWVKL